MFRSFAIVFGLTLMLGGAAAKPVKPACAHEIFEDQRFTVCRYDPTRDRLTLSLPSGDRWHMSALKAGLGSRAAKVRFAINAGMFDEHGQPIGLYVADGHVEHPLNADDGAGNFYLKPNGVFSVDGKGKARIDTAEAYQADPPAAQFATQSGPMLVIAGAIHPQISPDGASRFVRNGVGVSAGRGVYFAISDEPVSFGRFARLFRDRLNCPDALYLDGSISSLWAPAMGRLDDVSAIGPIAVISRKSH